MTTSIDKEFTGQVNTAWGLTIQTTNKVPEVAKRIFKTKSAAEAYIKDINDTAIEGLILTVVEDDTNNGAYFVKSIKTSETDEKGGELVKLSNQTEVDSKINVVKNSIPTNISDFTNESGYIESNTADREIKLKHYNLEADDEQTNVIDLSFTGITLEYNQRNTASDEYIKNALIIDNDGVKIKKDYNDASGAERNGSLIATEAYVDNAIAGGISNNYLLKESNEPQTISVTIIDEFNEGCYDRSLLSINGTGLTCAFSKVNTPGKDPIEGSIEITNSKDYIDIKPDKDINLLQHSLTINHKAVSLDGHTHNGLEKIAQLEATITAMQQTINSLQQQIEGLTTGQGIVTPQNIGQFAVTSITGENSDISATERDANGNVVISLNSITNIAFEDATEIKEENTVQF